MATICIDLGRGYISCTACGRGTSDGVLMSPCPHCGCRFYRVMYKRDKVRVYTTQLFDRNRFTLLDMELEKINALEYVWDRVERHKWADPEQVYEEKKKYFKLRGITLPEICPDNGSGQTSPGGDEHTI